MAWGWQGFVGSSPAAPEAGGAVPYSRLVYGPTGEPYPVPEPFPAGPANAAPIVDTPLQWSGGRTANCVDPQAGQHRVQLQPPVQYCNARVQPHDYGQATPGRGNGDTASIGNEIIRVLPSDPHITPWIRPPKLIMPQLAQAGTAAAVRQAQFARGGAPRSIRAPEGIATPSPSVVTRWDVYG